MLGNYLQQYLRIVNENLDPVCNAKIEFYLRDTGYSEFEFSDNNGRVKIPPIHGYFPTSCLVNPSDGHWCTYFDEISANIDLICESYSKEIDLNWWLALVGLNDITDQINSVKIGIIDTGFKPILDNQNVHVLGIEGNEYNEVGEISHKHGFAVAKVINDCVQPNHKSAIFLVDVTNQDDENYEFDSDKVGAAITMLSEDFDVDIINISGGIYVDENNQFHASSIRKLHAEVINATENGCVIVAAAGNDQAHSLALPAGFPEVISVGAIGQRNLAPEKTFYGRTEAMANDRAGSCGQTIDGVKVFADVCCCSGENPHVVAPGVGIILKYTDGTIFEQHGTSFAAPIVSSVLALEIEDSRNHIAPDDKQNYYFIKDRLKLITQDLGIKSELQGLGMPIRKKEHSPIAN